MTSATAVPLEPGDGRSYNSCIYSGVVVHRRLRPKSHALKYSVFAACFDVDEIDRLDREWPGFSRNRRNWLSFHDRDHGAPDGKPVDEHIRETLHKAGLAGGDRVRLLCYPRMFGYVFNPLSVYFCADGRGALRTIVYEVNNTFGERTSYVVPVDGDGDVDAVIAQKCKKIMAVSPFTEDAGSYGFRVRPPGADVLVGVAFRDAGGPVIRTHFSGRREGLSATSVARLLMRYPLMTFKVIAGIHWEAARLFGKGVPVVSRQKGPAYSVAHASPVVREPAHVG